MQAASVDIPRRMVGPFAIHDVFPFNAEPVIVYDLALRKHNVCVGLDVIDSLFAEIRAEEDRDVEMDPHIDMMIQWRALCHINTRTGQDHDLLSPLSRDGTQLVKAFAPSQEMTSEASLAIIVQGIAGHIRWDYNTTPPSLILYSILPNGSHLKFRVRSLESQTLHCSIQSRYLLLLDTIKWLRANKSSTNDTSLDGIIGRYRQEFPCERAHQEQGDNRKQQVHRSHIRTVLMTLISMRSVRKVILKEGLIARTSLRTVIDDFKFFKEMGHLREAQPTRYLPPQALPRLDMMETDTPQDQPTTKHQIDEILYTLSMDLFLFHDLPTAAEEEWSCPSDDCDYTIRTKPRPGNADDFDTAILALRQRISKHLWEEHISKNLSQDSLRKLVSYLPYVEPEIM